MELKNNSFVLTISYGNYTTGVGGTDKVILSQSKLFHEHNISTIHLFPKIGVWQKKPGIMWGVIVDGKYYACLVKEQIITQFESLIDCGKALRAVLIHHLQWTNLEDVSYLLEHIHSRVFFYLHDYMTVCPLGGLIFSKEFFCGPDRPKKDKCTGCRYYTEENIRRLIKTDGLLESIRSRLTVIAPSETAAGIWLKSHKDFSDSVIVLPHQRQVGKYSKNLQPKGNREAVKIAFVGYQSERKGWPQWIDAVAQARKYECNYEYYQFGTVNDHFEFIKEVPIDFRENLSAMTDALRDHQIDVAVLWSIWPETYSYTYYESLAANCFVLTNHSSGNIREQVRIRGNGLVSMGTCLTDVLLDEQKLRNELALFRNKQLYGPEQLIDNDEIFMLIESQQG